LEGLLFGESHHHTPHEFGPPDEMRRTRTYLGSAKKKLPKATSPDFNKQQARRSLKRIRRARRQNIRSGVTA